MSPPKYVDLVLLAAALAVFLLAGLPMLGYAVVAAVWLAQLGIQVLAGAAPPRSSQPATASGRWA